MNEHLDVLRYWLPEWSVSTQKDYLILATDDESWDTSDDFGKDHLCAELRRKYLEREGYGESR